MGFWRPFAKFDPLADKVPYWPYPQLSGIVWRAKNLLRGRTTDQISHIVTIAGEMIDDYFKQAEDDELQRLIKEQQYEFLETDEDGNVRGILHDRIDELDFPTKDNTDEFDALAECVGNWSGVFGDDTPDPADYEYFAAVALSLVADSIYALTYSYNFKTSEDVKKEKQNLGTDDYRQAGVNAIRAMEALGYAEIRKKEERLEDRFQDRLKAAEKHVSAKVQKANEAKWKALQAEESKQKSEHAKKMAALSKKNRNESMAAVLAEWDKQPSLQKLSNAKAGVRLSEWLSGQDLEFFEPRTVSLWISDHKKGKTIP